MTSPSQRRLAECDTMLANIITHYGTAIRRLQEALPGFPARTPGSGEPGGGKGYVAGSITERLATLHSSELDTYRRTLELPAVITTATTIIAQGATLEHRPHTYSHNVNERRLQRAQHVIQQLAEQNHQPPLTNLAMLHRRIADLEHITREWGAPLRTPPRQDLIPTDLTGMWCTSCLRIGDKVVRHRGDRCRWCYEFEQNPLNPFTPPVELLEKRRRTGKVWDRDVEPFRKAWRERQKRKKRRA